MGVTVEYVVTSVTLYDIYCGRVFLDGNTSLFVTVGGDDIALYQLARGRRRLNVR